MVQILTGSFLLSIIHAAIPNHWLPLVVLGKNQGWSHRETLMITVITGIAHTLSTILIGIVVGILGYKLAASHELFTKAIAPVILIVLGLILVVADLKGSHHHHHFDRNVSAQRRSKYRIVAALSMAMFFSPCLEIEAYYFTAALFGWLGILTVSIVYLSVTVTGMAILVDLALRGVQKIRWHFLEHHERGLTGAVLVVLGVLAYLVDL